MPTHPHVRDDSDLRRQFRRQMLIALARRRMNQSDLARALGITRVNVTRALTGHFSPTLRTVLSYATAVGCRVVFYFEEEN